ERALGVRETIERLARHRRAPEIVERDDAARDLLRGYSEDGFGRAETKACRDGADDAARGLPMDVRSPTDGMRVETASCCGSEPEDQIDLRMWDRDVGDVAGDLVADERFDGARHARARRDVDVTDDP